MSAAPATQTGTAAPPEAGMSNASLPDASLDRSLSTPPSPQRTPNPARARYRRSNQQKPGEDRYREIQQALADRGYLDGEVDGQWGPGSREALKRFQRDQKLRDDGKLGALTLTALGFGPRAEWAPGEIQGITANSAD